MNDQQQPISATPPSTTDNTLTLVAVGVPSESNLPTLALKTQKSGDIIPVSRITPEEEVKIVAYEKSVNFGDTNTIRGYASAPQGQISTFLDTLLADIKTKEMGAAGDLAIALSKGFDDMELEEMKKELDETGEEGFSFMKFARKLPFIGRAVSHLEHFVEREQAVVTHLKDAESKANKRKRELMVYNVKLDTELEYSYGYLAELKLWIIAGERALLRGKAEYAKKQEDTELLKDPMEAAKLHDFEGRLVAFEVRLINLYLAYTKWSTLTPTKIRMIQESTNIEIDRIFETILCDMPDLKSLILELAALIKIRLAQKEGRQRDDVKTKMERLADQLGQETYIAAKQSQGDVLGKVKTLQERSQKMIETLEKGRQIERETSQQRAEAVQLLIQVRDNTAAELSKLDRAA